MEGGGERDHKTLSETFEGKVDPKRIRTLVRLPSAFATRPNWLGPTPCVPVSRSLRLCVSRGGFSLTSPSLSFRLCVSL